MLELLSGLMMFGLALLHFMLLVGIHQKLGRIEVLMIATETRRLSEREKLN